ncbi:MAG: tetratricopeptide repeat protein [Caldilineaceae bacterium]
MSDNRLAIYMLGGLQIRRNDHLVTELVSRKAEALLAYLACNQRPYPRDILADFFWEDRTQSQAAGNLRVVLNSLRRTLKPFVAIDRHSVAINQASHLWVDVLAFEGLLTDFVQTTVVGTELAPALVEQIEAALALYRGEFLAGFFIRQAPLFEEWARIERERFHILATKALQALSLHYLATQQYSLGINAVERWLHLDLLNEEAHRTLMRLLAEDGHRSAALQHYERIVDLFQHELGNAPSAETETLYHQILDDVVMPASRSARTVNSSAVTLPAVALPAVTSLPHNLTAPLSPIVGREAELTQILQRLQAPACRLLTLIGIGGIGKTRLALEAALRFTETAAVQSLFADGVFWVPLEHVETSSHLLSAIAQAVHYSFQGAVEPVKQLLEFLRHRRLLLVLDNVEQVTDQSELLLQILQAASGIKLLITSRERLNFQGEWLLELKGLPYPQTTDPATWDTYPATQLFVQCAVAVAADFVPQMQHSAIVQICQLMEGLPLGIQLAAASVRLFNGRQIVAAIQRNLDFLSSTMRNLPLRHRSLRAIFDHSWLLLSVAEQHAFQRLALFAGSFTSEAAETVAEIPTTVLLALMDKSLVQVMPSEATVSATAGEPRYRMHPILHQYAMEKLTASADAGGELASRYAYYYGNIVATQAPLLHTAAAAGAIDCISLDLENIRKGWQAAASLRLLDVLCLSLPGLIQYYRLRGLFGEGQTLLAVALETMMPNPDALRAGVTPPADPPQSESGEDDRESHLLICHLFAYQAMLFNDAERYEEAIAAATTAATVAQAIQDREGEALSALQWGISLHRQGNYDTSDQKLEDALQFATAAGASLIAAEVYLTMGRNRFYLGDYAGGQVRHEQALVLYRTNGDLVDELAAQNSLAMLYLFAGDYAKARTSYKRCLHDYQLIGNRPAIGLMLNNLGALATLLGHYQEAQRYYEESLALRRLVGGRQSEALILANLALIWHQTNAHEKALQYSQLALRLSIELGERDTEAYARLCLGHALAALGQWTAAAASYQLAVTARRQAGQHTQALEPLAGLARVALAQGNLDQAKAHVDQIVPRLGSQTYAGLVELIRIYLTCYQVLAACQDEQAERILTLGYTILQERAAKIAEDEMRTFYFQIAVHRELRLAYEQRRGL